VHEGAGTAATAERLMRSRYSAYVLGDVDHLLRTWHPSTRPASLQLDDDLRWDGLEVLARERGGPFDDEGTVEFRAHHRHRFADGRGAVHEVSRFVREAGRWFYVGEVVHRA
jgi:SEC-C motif-containing protein